MHISELLTSVEKTTANYGSQYPNHQKLVYAIESVVDRVLPSPTVDLWGARSFIENLCADLEVDVPTITREKIKDNHVACAMHGRYHIVLGQSVVSTLTLCHELSHLLVEAGVGHHKPWRDKFVDTARHAVSIEHGALLCTLYNRSDLTTDWKK